MIARVLRVLVLTVGSIGLAVFTRLRPHRWFPPALSLPVLRRYGEFGSAALAAGMRGHVPDGGRRLRTDLSYAPGRDGLFDLVVPEDVERPALIVWLHGGGGYYGSKADPLPYAELLARRGYAVAVLNYPRVPEHRFPAAPRAVFTALGHLRAHAEEYGVDPERIVLAGDSAGAQLAGAVAAAWSAPAYARALGIDVTPPRSALRATALFCGTFNARALTDVGRVYTALLASAMWAQVGTRHWERSDTADLMTLADHVDGGFPATFLRAGDADPLTATGSVPFGDRLSSLGVEVDSAVVRGPHQVQFALGTPAAEEILDALVAFLDRFSLSPL